MFRQFVITFSLISLSLGACATAQVGDGGDDTPDAAGLPDIDARPDLPGVDAMPPPPMVDAMPLPDAPPPCTDTTVQLLTSPNFDVNPGAWTEQAVNPIVNDSGTLPIAPQTGNNAVWLGGVDNVTRTIYQDVAIPLDATDMSISFYRWVASVDSTITVYDTMSATLRNTGGGILETLGSWSNVSGDRTTTWTLESYAPAGNFAGQTVRFYLTSNNDISDNTNFFIDSASLTVTTCL